MSPRAWRLESVDDRAQMLGIFLFEATIESYRQDWREQKEARDKKNDGAENEFRKMKDRMGRT